MYIYAKVAVFAARSLMIKLKTKTKFYLGWPCVKKVNFRIYIHTFKFSTFYKSDLFCDSQQNLYVLKNMHFFSQSTHHCAPKEDFSFRPVDSTDGDVHDRQTFCHLCYEFGVPVYSRGNK